MPAAEESGLIAPIGEWVLREACAVASTWPDHICVAVNLSPIQFRKNRKLVEQVKSALSAAALSLGRLELEITELVLLADDESAVLVLRELKKLGVRIALDDFGTGYSSLSYLRRFPFDKIKIDRTFVQEFLRERRQPGYRQSRHRPRTQPWNGDGGRRRRNRGPARYRERARLH